MRGVVGKGVLPILDGGAHIPLEVGFQAEFVEGLGLATIGGGDFLGGRARGTGGLELFRSLRVFGVHREDAFPAVGREVGAAFVLIDLRLGQETGHGGIVGSRGLGDRRGGEQFHEGLERGIVGVAFLGPLKEGGGLGFLPARGEIGGLL